jgi:Uma2 family endonuclease
MAQTLRPRTAGDRATQRWEMPELVLRSPGATWDLARWELLPEDGNRYEVIDGVLYMTTAPSSYHQYITKQIARVLLSQIDDAGVGETLWAPIGVIMPGCEPVQPDLVVVRAADRNIFQDRRIRGVPALIIEILSPSNSDQDLDVKRKAYAAAGLAEYWIVRPEERDLLLCSQPTQSLAAYLQTDHIPPDGELVSPTLPIKARIASFFTGAPDPTP